MKLNMEAFYEVYNEAIDNIPDQHAYKEANILLNIIQQAAKEDRELSIALGVEPECIKIDEHMGEPFKGNLMKELEKIKDNQHRAPKKLHWLVLNPGLKPVQIFIDEVIYYAGTLFDTIREKRAKLAQRGRTQKMSRIPTTRRGKTRQSMPAIES